MTRARTALLGAGTLLAAASARAHHAAMFDASNRNPVVEGRFTSQTTR